MLNMPGEVARCADALLEALKSTEAFREYEQLKQTVRADAVNRLLLDRYLHAQTALQMAAMAGSEPKPEDTAEFERLSALLYESAEVTDYLLAQMKVQQLVAATLQRITDAADISIDFKEA